jgi:hypothetical protein
MRCSNGNETFLLHVKLFVRSFCHGGLDRASPPLVSSSFDEVPIPQHVHSSNIFNLIVDILPYVSSIVISNRDPKVTASC